MLGNYFIRFLWKFASHETKKILTKKKKEDIKQPLALAGCLALTPRGLVNSLEGKTENAANVNGGARSLAAWLIVMFYAENVIHTALSIYVAVAARSGLAGG